IIKDNKKHSLEKTIVRPSFSYLGKYTISERVIKQIVVYVINDITKDLLVNSIKVEKNQEGIKVEIGLVIKKLCKLDEMANIIIDRIKNDIEYMTGINVDRVTVIYKSFKG
ncbi:MAG: Asp23/Gls24 family envelope stress response protein, partial [Caloramator sp.]|nr:Asp23/Gls24 family envelope stress response protein [Caloramator sp.]